MCDPIYVVLRAFARCGGRLSSLQFPSYTLFNPPHRSLYRREALVPLERAVRSSHSVSLEEQLPRMPGAWHQVSDSPASKRHIIKRTGANCPVQAVVASALATVASGAAHFFSSSHFPVISQEVTFPSCAAEFGGSLSALWFLAVVASRRPVNGIATLVTRIVVFHFILQIGGHANHSAVGTVCDTLVHMTSSDTPPFVDCIGLASAFLNCLNGSQS